MNKKIIWLIVSCLMVVALVLASCAPAVVEEKKAKVVTKEPEKKAEEVVVPALGEPQYGGTLNIPLTVEPRDFDPWSSHSVYAALPFANMVYDKPFLGDFTLTEEEWPCYHSFRPKSTVVGMLVETWEVPEPGTIILHLRKDVHFQNLPPVNGREMTADDMVYSFDRNVSPECTRAASRKVWYLSMKALDRYTVELKYTSLSDGWWVVLGFRGMNFTIPHEVVEKYGSLKDPMVAVGTGPYIIKDWVQGSSLTFERNPGYWGKDPEYPENTLPYIEEVFMPIIPDIATQMAALRTGKVDLMGPPQFHEGVRRDLALSLIQTNPELKYREMLTQGMNMIGLRVDIEPFSDVRVRQALSMAVDRHALVDQYYQGAAEYATMIMSPTVKGWGFPMEERPANIRGIMEYNPEEARQLLAAAGYSEGFPMEVIASVAKPQLIEILELVKGWYADINVTVTIKPMENAAFESLKNARKHPQAFIRSNSAPSLHNEMLDLYSATLNPYCFDDPVFDEKVEKSMEAMNQPEPERLELYRDAFQYILEQCPYIDLPAPNFYLLWQPWLMRYWGQYGMTHGCSGGTFKYLWIDQDLKKEMGH